MEFSISDKYVISVPEVPKTTETESNYVTPIYAKCIKIDNIKNGFISLASILNKYDSEVLVKAFDEFAKYPELYQSIIKSVDLIVRSEYDQNVREFIETVFPIRELKENKAVEELYDNDESVSEPVVLIPDEVIDDTEESDEDEIIPDASEEYENEEDNID